MGKKAFALCFLLFMLCLMSSSVKALAWNPEATLKAYLKENYPWAEIEIDNLLIGNKLPDEQPLKVVAEKGPPGKTIFIMEFRTGAKITATANVKAFDRAIMSGRAFRKGHYLKEDDVFTKLIDITRIPKGAIRNTDQVIGKTLARSIVANALLVDTMVSDKPTVKRGHKVTLIVEAPSFIITTRGEIKENGWVGSYVKVVNLLSKKVISGLLVDENTVRVEF